MRYEVAGFKFASPPSPRGPGPSRSGPAESCGRAGHWGELDRARPKRGLPAPGPGRLSHLAQIGAIRTLTKARRRGPAGAPSRRGRFRKATCSMFLSDSEPEAARPPLLRSRIQLCPCAISGARWY